MKKNSINISIGSGFFFLVFQTILLVLNYISNWNLPFYIVWFPVLLILGVILMVLLIILFSFIFGVGFKRLFR